MGELLREEGCMEVFRNTLSDCQLDDVGYEGPWFTWEKGHFVENNIRERFFFKAFCHITKSGLVVLG